MIRSLFGPSSVSYALRGGLQEAMRSHQSIAARVAGRLDASSQDRPSGATQPGESAEAAARKAESDLQRDMTELADTQIRYEADARLLQAAYSRLRAAVRSHG